MADTSEQGKKIISAHDGKLRLELQNNRLLIFDGENNLGFIGVRDDGSIGYDFAPAGVEVLTAAVSQLVASDRLRTFTIAVTDTVQATRLGGNDSGYVDVDTGALGAPMFFSTVRAPAASPSFRHQTPFLTYYTGGSDSGKIIGNKRSLYDPSTGVIRFFVEATSLNPSYGSNETWEFQYFLLYQNIP